MSTSEPSTESVAVGAVIGSYRVEGHLGRGGMATVYRVRHVTLDSVYALKLLHLTQPQVRQRLLREGRAQAQLRHPNVLGVYDVLEHRGCPALVLEYVDGPDLDELIRLRRLRFPHVTRLARGILYGVRAAHRLGLVHRDLKPGNILLAVHDDTIVPKVADFGLAKEVDGSAQGLTQAGQVFGTPNYMAPEQFRGAANVDLRADLFAFGCILYEMVCGRLAFPGDDLFDVHARVTRGQYTPMSRFRPEVPEHLLEVVDRCLATDPAGRFASCDEILARLGGTSDEPDDAAVLPPRGPTAEPGLGADEAPDLRISDAELEQLRSIPSNLQPSTVPPLARTAPAPLGVGPVLLGLATMLAVAAAGITVAGVLGALVWLTL